MGDPFAGLRAGLDAYAAESDSGSICLVVQGGKVCFRHAAPGCLGGEPTTDATLVRWYSMTKLVVSVAVLRLVSERKWQGLWCIVSSAKQMNYTDGHSKQPSYIPAAAS